jgi:nitrite reductase/ring-hydroxylating ferredoxin subunit
MTINGSEYILIPDVVNLESLSSKAFTVVLEGRGALDGFLVRDGEGVLYAYKNSCPHTGAPLNWMPDQFLTTSKRYIQCSVHGAMFKTDDGVCFSGPCVGKSLMPLKVAEREAGFYIACSEIKKSQSV